MLFHLPLIRTVAVCAIAVASISAQDQSFASLQRKAGTGDAIAQFDLAKAYFSGTGVAKDPEQGLTWLRKSAAQGYVGAEFALGYMYQKGAQKVPNDQHEAANWFRKAARQQNKAAQDQLSSMLVQGLISAKEADWRISDAPKQAITREPQKSKNNPTTFSLAEIETGLTGGITAKRMATLVQTYGVNFNLNDSTRKKLADEGADENLLTTISESKRS